MSSDASSRTVGAGFARGLSRRCPACGQGRLFRGYLKVEETCPSCGHVNGQYRADDGPAYFTILIVGHLVLAPMLCFGFILSWPPQVLVPVVLGFLAVVTLTLLPFVKGAFIGVQWATKGTKEA
jgi:uncharacterized protein (DUF983 family)